MSDWKNDLHVEFERAAAARAKGNEGQARVCARRAAGIAIRESLTRQGKRPPSLSAYDLLNLIKEDAALSPTLRLIADHLTLRVTEEFKLPVDADLVAEARTLCQALLADFEA
jgi:HEPN domain-containing protein